ATVDLALNITSSHCYWLYNANLFSHKSIIRFSECFDALLTSIIAGVDTPIHSLSLLRPEQKQQLLDQSANNNTVVDYPACSIQDLFSQQVARTPDNIAIRAGATQISYAQLNQQANQLAHVLIGRGVKPNTLVGVCLERNVLLLTSILAILKAGATYVPLDPGYPKARLGFMLADSKVATVICQKQQLAILGLADDQVICLDDGAIARNQLPTDNPQLPPLGDLNAYAYVMYTSGSTGEPKGVIGTHKSVINRLLWMQRQYPISAAEVFAVKTTISFVDHIAEVLQPLTSGATCVILQQQELNDAASLAKAIDRYQISRITLVPSLLKPLLQHQTSASLSSLNVVMSSGEPLHYEVTELFHQKLCAKNGPQTELLNLYGATEVGADVSCYRLDAQTQNQVLDYFTEVEAFADPGPSARDTSAIGVEHIFSRLNEQHQGEDTELYTRANVSLDDLSNSFSDSAIPPQPQRLGDYIGNLSTDLVPYTINVAAEKYVGHMTSALPSFIPEFSRLIAKYNQNIVKVETSKSLTLMERQVLAMMHRLFYHNIDEAQYDASIQDPDYLHGIITSGGSLANITALYCARNKGLMASGISNSELVQIGAAAAMHKLGYKDAVILVSRLAHYSVKKAAALLGLGQQNLLIIEQDDSQKIKMPVLEQTIQQCRDEKRFIIAIIGIAGATETGTVDPLEAIADIAEKHQIHFHADAAWGGAFMFSDKYRHKLNGIERADSITICAHKQLYLAQGISLCLFKDPRSLFSARTHADYQAQPGSFDLGQFTIEGSRPASSLMLHATLHLLSKSGYAWLVDQGMEKTAFFRQLIENSACFELTGENDLNIINYRYIPVALRGVEGPFSDAQNQQIDEATDAIQTQQFFAGHTFVSKTKIIHQRFSANKITVFRVVLTNPRTNFDHLVEVLEDQLRIAESIIEEKAEEKVESSDQQQQIINNAEAFERRNPGMVTTPIGKAIDNVSVYILDNYLCPVPMGVIGEIYIAGDCLAAGYLNRPELTAACFIDNPFVGAEQKDSKLYKTGDLARRLSDGNIEFYGRYDHQVKVSGLRVELAEIEMQLMKLTPVKQAVVMAKQGALSAYLVISEAADCDLLKTQLANRLPGYMIPANFKVIDKIPLTANGKTDLKQLALI
ncbi:MAG: putative pyridoxal-dependent aspartate 1-decarboxylase, partial [Phenylobacterium sp.]